MEDEMHFSTQWGVSVAWPNGEVTYSDCQDRATAEKIIHNMSEAAGLTAELVWRGVTPWMKALI